MVPNMLSSVGQSENLPHVPNHHVLMILRKFSRMSRRYAVSLS